MPHAAHSCRRGHPDVSSTQSAPVHPFLVDPVRLVRRATATKINASTRGIAIPSLIAGAIYVVVALATGAPTVVAIVVGIVIAAAAAVVGLIFRAVYKRRGS